MSNIEEKSHYELLNVNKNATIDEIKKAYRKLALVHHPDKGGDPEIFKRLSIAYQILINAELRNKYDQSLPIPETILIPPLKVFYDCFSQWLKQYPLVEYFFKDSCHDIIELLNKHSDNPIVKTLINSLANTDDKQLSTDDLLKATNYFTTEWFTKLYPNKGTTDTNTKTIEKKVYITLHDMYIGKRYPHQFVITNEDLHLSNDFKIVNPDVQINIPLQHSAIDIESELHIINQRYETSHTQKVITQLDVITTNDMPPFKDSFRRIGDYDLLAHVDITLEQFINLKVMAIPYFKTGGISFYNPGNCNLRQLYKIENVALPNRELKKRGDLFILFNLILHKNQKSNLLSGIINSHIYNLVSVPFESILKYDEINAKTEENKYGIDGLMLAS